MFNQMIGECEHTLVMLLQQLNAIFFDNLAQVTVKADGFAEMGDGPCIILDSRQVATFKTARQGIISIGSNPEGTGFLIGWIVNRNDRGFKVVQTEAEIPTQLADSIKNFGR